VPALAVLVAFWIDDVLDGRIRHVGAMCAAASTIVLLITRDLMGEQKKLIELFVYRYDRPWPDGAPWYIDLSDPILGFGLAFAALMLLLAIRRLRPWVFVALAATAVLATYWTSNVYMRYAAMHWGQRAAIQAYYEQREIHGIDVHYDSPVQLAREWEGFSGDYLIETVVPEHLSPGKPMQIELLVGGSRPKSVALHGRISRIGDERFWVHIDADELARLQPMIEASRGQEAPASRAWKELDADRLLAWQLYWRGENFWSGDEIWGRSDETRTAFKNTDNKEFLQYLNTKGRHGQRYFVITEAGRVRNLPSILPTRTAKDTLEVVDESCNKFTLVSFIL
jgi:hypothetical protein